jgi:hypothetical protein
MRDLTLQLRRRVTRLEVRAVTSSQPVNGHPPPRFWDALAGIPLTEPLRPEWQRILDDMRQPKVYVDPIEARLRAVAELPCGLKELTNDPSTAKADQPPGYGGQRSGNSLNEDPRGRKASIMIS